MGVLVCVYVPPVCVVAVLVAINATHLFLAAAPRLLAPAAEGVLTPHTIPDARRHNSMRLVSAEDGFTRIKAADSGTVLRSRLDVLLLFAASRLDGVDPPSAVDAAARAAGANTWVALDAAADTAAPTFLQEKGT